MADPRGLFRIRSPLSGRARLLLAALPFAVLLIVYSAGSAARHRENPKDKLMPDAGQLAAGLDEILKLRKSEEDCARRVGREDEGAAALAAATPDPEDGLSVRVEALWLRAWSALPAGARRGWYRWTSSWLASDTLTSLRRLTIAVVIAVAAAILLGLFMGTFTIVDALFSPFLRALSKIPPLALLPMLFIYLGTDEAPKLALMAIGVFPTLAQDVYLRIRDVPQEMVNKAYTLGASTLEVVIKLVLRQAWPRILDSVRLTIGPLWVFLIASEAIASESGLGYRIYIVQRYLGVNIILPYILWISLVGFLMDASIRLWVRWRHPWALAD